MKAPREIKLWINKRRSKDGKRNGIVRWLFDSPRVEGMMLRNKNNKSVIKKQELECR